MSSYANISTDQRQRLVSHFRACCPNSDEGKPDASLELSKTEVGDVSLRVLTGIWFALGFGVRERPTWCNSPAGLSPAHQARYLRLQAGNA